MGHSHGTHWTTLLIMQALEPFAEELGRMPSANELRGQGRNDLACAISRRGGFKSWADRLGVGLKGSETELGQRVEREVAAWLEGEGFDVRRQTTRAPFDLLVNGHRVDVKSAHYTEYRKQGAEFNIFGWVFGLSKVPATCDVYLLVCLSDSDEHMRRYIIPAAAAQVQTITITERGKYEPFRDALDHLRC